MMVEQRNDVLISIVTVCFNDCGNLERTFRSIRENKNDYQKYYIVDGGSTDGTIELIQKNKQIIDGFISEKDGGLYDAMNKSIHLAADNSYILWLNAGDELLEWDHKQLSSIRKYDCAYFSVIQKTVPESIGYVKRPRIKLPLNERNVTPATVFRHQAFLVKKKVFQKHLYDLTVGHKADALLMSIMQRDHTYYVDNSPLSVFYIDGISNKNFKEAFRSYFKVIERLELSKWKVLLFQYNYIIKLLLKTFLPHRLVKILQEITQRLSEIVLK